MYGFAYQPFRMAHFSKPRPQDAMNFPVYMDSAAPNGGLGTKDSPINNLNTAILMVTGQIGAEIHVRATASNPIRQQPIPFESTNDLTIKGWDGEDWYCYGSEIVTGWVEVGGGIWKTPLAFTVVKIAVVMTMTETVGDREFFVKLVLSDTPQTPSQGEIGYVNNELFICLPNNENPNNHIICEHWRQFGLQTEPSSISSTRWCTWTGRSGASKRIVRQQKASWRTMV